MVTYTGIQTQIRKNNQRTALVLVLFPALVAALRKISGNAGVSTVSNKAVAQLFIENALDGERVTSLFSSHPPILKRIEVLEQF